MNPLVIPAEAGTQGAQKKSGRGRFSNALGPRLRGDDGEGGDATEKAGKIAG